MWKLLVSVLTLGGVGVGMGVAVFNPEVYAGFFSDLFGAEGVARAIADGTIAVSQAKVDLAMIAAIKDSMSAFILIIALCGGIVCFTAPMYATMEWLKMVKDFGQTGGKLDKKEVVLSIVGAAAIMIFGGTLIKFGWFLMKASESGLRELM